MAVADAIADLADVVDLAKTLKANWDSTYSAILSTQIGAPTEDDYGRLRRLGLDVTAGWRANFAAMLESIRPLADVVLADVARELDRGDVNEESDPVTILGALRTWMVDNATVFKKRAVTHNAVSALTSPLTSGADGALLMLSTDDQSSADDLEAITHDTLKFECVADQGSGQASGRELFSVYASAGGGAAGRDILEYDALSQPVSLEVVSAATASGVLNGSFEQTFSGTGTDKIPSWTFTSGQANVAAEATTVYRGDQSIKATGAFLLKQAYAALDPAVPVIVSVMYNATNVSTGVITLRIGGVSTTVAISTVDDGTWRRLTFFSWPKRFSGSGFDVELEIDASGGAPDNAVSGTVYFDELVVHPLTRLGGRYFALLAGATDFAQGDYFTQQSQITGTGLIKDWLHRWYGNGFELPHAAAATAGWTDPA